MNLRGLGCNQVSNPDSPTKSISSVSARNRDRCLRKAKSATNCEKAIEGPTRSANGTSRKSQTLPGGDRSRAGTVSGNVEGDLDTCRRLVTGGTLESTVQGGSRSQWEARKRPAG